MLLEAGRNLLHYRLIAEIGSGGMGVVWKARDLTLDRDVALKFLPESFARDASRLARFEREARLLASLRNPGIATIHGLHESEGCRFLTMELLNGENLAQRLERGPLPVAEALEVATHVAIALEAAHASGVVHRDLKPSNLQRMEDGTIKVLDFGLAKSASASSQDEGDDAAASPTRTLDATAEGMVLGTAGYMSPEQARGQAVNQQADVWSFGVVLYELLTGERLFDGTTPSDVIAGVLRSSIDLQRLPPETPWRVVGLLRRCLERDLRGRWHAMADVRIELEAARDDTGAPSPPDAPISGRRGLTAALLLGLAGLVVGAWSGVTLMRPDPPAASTSSRVRFRLVPPPETRHPSNPVLSGDGSTLVYLAESADGRARLFSHRFETAETVSLPGTEGASAPMLSPDGRWVAFFGSGLLRKMSLAGGHPVPVCEVADSPGGAWLSDGSILYSPGWTTGLWSVPSEGGQPEVVTTPDAEAGEAGHWWPDPLPDQRSVLFSVWTAGTGLNDARVALLDLETRRWRVLFPGAYARFAPPDRIVFFRAGSYFSVPFDAGTLRVTGPATPLNIGIRKQHPNGSKVQSLSFSGDGKRAFVPGDAFLESTQSVWIDHTGREEPLVTEPTPVHGVAISPDGTRLAVCRLEQGLFGIWIRDLERGTEERLPVAGSNFGPRWRPDGRRISFGSVRKGVFDIYDARPDGSNERALSAADTDDTPEDWSPDGETLLILVYDQAGSIGISLLDPQTGTRRPYLHTAANEGDARFSPDGRWIAYASNSSGGREVYVEPVARDAPRVRVSTAGGNAPLWSPVSNELYYRRDGDAIAVDYSVVGNRFSVSNERVLFTRRLPRGSIDRDWDIHPDGRRFLVQKRPDGPREPDGIEVILDY